MAPPTEVATAGPRSYPDIGLGRGWEPAALVALSLLLLSFGLVTLYSTSSLLAQRMGYPDYHFVLRQCSAGAMGLVALVICAKIPYTTWQYLAWPLLGLTTFALLLLVLPGTEAIAPEWNGSRRWLRIGVQFQPSEVAKLAVVVWTAGLAVRKQPHFQSLSQGLLPFLVVWAVITLLVAAEPDLSTAVVILFLGGTVVFAAGARIAHFLFLGLLALPLLIGQLMVSFRWQRVLAFLDPASDPSGAGFQIHQSLIALGSGGLTGQGFAKGRQKFGFLPEPHTDFMFSMIGEEWGFVGVVGLVLAYVAVVLVGFRIARRAPDLFGELLAVGLASFVAVHATLHMFVGLGLVPSTGLPLPMISYGRSNLVITLAAVGILISISRASARAPGTAPSGRGRRRA